MNNLSNLSVERAVLSAYCQYGEDARSECDFIEVDHFSNDSNQLWFKCIERVLSKGKVEFSSLLSAASELGYSKLLEKEDEITYLRSLFNFPIAKENVSFYASKLVKLRFAKDSLLTLKIIETALLKTTGDEDIEKLIDVVESPISDLTNKIYNGEDKVCLISEDIDEYLDYVENNPVETLGIDTGYKEWQNCIGGLTKGGFHLIGGRQKAQPLTAKVLTPSGFVNMGDLKVGDEICHPDGGTSKIEYVYPQGKKEVFEFTFSDQTKTRACEDHLWKTKSIRWKDFKVISLKQMNSIGKLREDSRAKYQFPIVNTVDFNNIEVTIDPYIMGVLLGDGSIKYYVSFTSNDIEIVESVRSKLTNGYRLTNNKYQYDIVKKQRSSDQNFYKEELKRYGLFGLGSHDKFIPEEYLINSLEKRKELLRGLLDTDGCSSSGKYIEYSTVSTKLRDDIIFLVKSLGGVAKWAERYTKCNGKSFKSYRVNISFNNNEEFFNLTRKKQSCKKRKKPNLKRTLKSVVSVGYEEVQCIKIDRQDGLYITDDFIVTHNSGKSLIADNIAVYVSKHMPVLMLDTEMSKTDHIHRILAMMSGVPTNEIKKGTYGGDSYKRDKVRAAAKKFKELKYDYKCVAGQPIDSILSAMKKWVKQVGLDENGNRKDCLVVYDYFKLMDSGDLSDNMAEFQKLGFQATKLHNFCVQYDVPCLSFIQLNRDGINKESSDVISQSDRIGWLCTSFSIFKAKSDEEFAEDGPQNGNRKMVVVLTRHGEGSQFGDYVNYAMNGKIASIRELGTRDQCKHRKDNDKGFEDDGTESSV